MAESDLWEFMDLQCRIGWLLSNCLHPITHTFCGVAKESRTKYDMGAESKCMVVVLVFVLLIFSLIALATTSCVNLNKKETFGKYIMDLYNYFVSLSLLADELFTFLL